MERKDNTGVNITFDKDAVRDVLPYLDEIKKNGLSVTAKNDVFGKIAVSVAIENMSEAIALLIKFAETKFLIPGVRESLFNTVLAWYVKKRPGVVYTTPERACAIDIYNAFTEHGFDILGKPRQYCAPDRNAKTQLVVYPNDRDLLVKTYSKMKFLAKSK